MKTKVFMICFFLMCMANASGFQRIIGLNHDKLVLQNAYKTEIFINNNSDNIIWVNYDGTPDLLFEGFTLHLYNDDEEIDKVRIQLSKTPFSEVFFNDLVPNHTRLKVTDYL